MQSVSTQQWLHVTWWSLSTWTPLWNPEASSATDQWTAGYGCTPDLTAWDKRSTTDLCRGDSLDLNDLALSLCPSLQFQFMEDLTTHTWSFPYSVESRNRAAFNGLYTDSYDCTVLELESTVMIPITSIACACVIKQCLYSTWGN